MHSSGVFRNVVTGGPKWELGYGSLWKGPAAEHQ